MQLGGIFFPHPNFQMLDYTIKSPNEIVISSRKNKK